MFSHAYRFEKFHGRNPVTQSRIHRQENSRERVLSLEEQERLLLHADRELRDLILLLLNSGCRLYEILSLRWDIVDFEAGKIHLPGSITKNGKWRDAEINPTSRTILLERKLITKNSPFVFPSDKSESGHLIHPYRRWYKLLKDVGIKDFRFHELRHTTGSRLRELNTHPEAIQKYLGHTDYKTT